MQVRVADLRRAVRKAAGARSFSPQNLTQQSV